MPLKVGDQVQLLSGGPVMTVKEVVQEHERSHMKPQGVHCQWFAGKKLESGVFPEESLQVPKDEKKN